MSKARRLTTFDLTCIGVNAIVGSGIFTLPGVLAKGLGPASILAFLVCGLLCVPLALGYAVAATRTESSGATYIYGRLAFGERIGFVTGWLAWTTSVVSWAAVAVALAPFVGHFFPWAAGGQGRPLAIAVIAGLCVLNVVGIRPSALFINGLAVIKIVPLVVLLVVGLAFFRADRLVPFAPHGYAAMGPVMYVALFAYQGFEVIGIPAGEARSAARAAPRAVIFAFLVSLALYAGLQTVAVMHAPDLAGSKKPLIDAAASLGGATFAAILGVTASLSILGFNAGSALGAPRYLSAMADERQVPASLGQGHPRFGTPYRAIVFTSLVTAGLAATLDFGRLVDMSNASVLTQYLVTMAALVRFVVAPPPGMTKLALPGGVLLPVLGALVALYLLVQPKAGEARPEWFYQHSEKIVVAGIVVVGLLVFESVRLVKARVVDRPRA